MATLEGRTVRQNPISIVLSVGKLLPILVILLFQAMQNVNLAFSLGGFSFSYLWIVALLIVDVFVTSLSWYFTTYTFDKKEIIFSKGIINKHKARIAYTRIHSVNTTSTLTQRIFRCVDLDLDIPAKYEFDGCKIAHISHRFSKEISAFIIQKRDAVEISVASSNVSTGSESSVPSKNKVSEEHDEVLASFRLNTMDLIIGSFANINLGALVAILFSLMAKLHDLLNLVGYDLAGGLDGVNEVLPISSAFVGFVSAFIFLLLVVSFIKNYLRFSSFKIARTSDHLTVKRGIFTKTFNNVSINRIQAVETSSNFFFRVFGYVMVQCRVVGTAGNNDSAKDTTAGQIIITPALKSSEFNSFIHELLPEFEDLLPVEDKRVIPKNAYGRCIRQALYLYLLKLSVIAVMIWVLADLVELGLVYMSFVYWVAGILAIYWLVKGVLQAFFRITETSYKHFDKGLMLCSGGIINKTIYIPKRCLQYVRINASLLQVHMNLCNIEVDTADTAQHFSISEMPEDAAFDLTHWIDPTFS